MIVSLLVLVKYNNFYLEYTGIEALNNWLTAGQPISQAERQREGKVAQTALEMKKTDLIMNGKILLKTQIVIEIFY